MSPEPGDSGRPAAVDRARPGGRVDDVTDGVLLARGFHLGSTIQVSTREGSVVIDTTGSAASAVRARGALYQRNPQHARYVIYTHCHPDHIGGAGEFVSAMTRDVIGHSLLPGLCQRDYECLRHWTTRIRSHQKGAPAEIDNDDCGDTLNEHAYIPPTVTFDDVLDLEVGGFTFHLEHTEGETRDHLLVWVPERSVLMPGDLFYAAFPNLSTPAIGPRPILGWIRSLNRMLEFNAEHLVPSHTSAISGKENVRSALTSYRDAIQHVWDESLKAIDSGQTVHDAARSIRLPARLASSPYLAETYGTVAWGVRAVYDSITGWYDGDIATLNPLPARERNSELVAAAGAAVIAGRAAAAHARGDHQLALELTSVVLSVEPRNTTAGRVRARACLAMSSSATNLNEQRFYQSGARLAEAALAEHA